MKGFWPELRKAGLHCMFVCLIAKSFKQCLVLSQNSLLQALRLPPLGRMCGKGARALLTKTSFSLFAFLRSSFQSPLKGRQDGREESAEQILSPRFRPRKGNF